MDVGEAIQTVRRTFPFDGYAATQEDAYRSIAAAVTGHLPPGGRILDFGSGPCDKTAVLSLLGYCCAASDDLGDDWHAAPGHQEKIQAFAAGAGVDFRRAGPGGLPFQRVLRGRTNLPPFAAYYWSQGAWRGHVREYARDDLVRLAEFQGLEVVSLRGCHHMLHRVPRALRPAYQAATAPFQGLKDSWLLVARKPAGWANRRVPAGRGRGEVPRWR